MFIAHINSMDTLARGLIIAGEMDEPKQISGKQALYESIINQYF